EQTVRPAILGAARERCVVEAQDAAAAGFRNIEVVLRVDRHHSRIAQPAGAIDVVRAHTVLRGTDDDAKTRVVRREPLDDPPLIRGRCRPLCLTDVRAEEVPFRIRSTARKRSVVVAGTTAAYATRT